MKPTFDYVLGLDTKNDPYLDALIANSLINKAKIKSSSNDIKGFLDKISGRQNLRDGSINGAITSITSSSGNNLIV